MIEALEAIAVFYGRQQGGNTAEARKSLRQVGEPDAPHAWAVLAFLKHKKKTTT